MARPWPLGQCWRSGAAAAAKVDPPLHVPPCEPVERCLYLAPGASRLEAYAVKDGPPPCPAGAVRVVCISDTHNEHAGLRLPAGDVLLHTGDVLTESGIRHMLRDKHSNRILEVKREGEALFEGFARWFGEQRFTHKVLIAGNHDLVLQGLGKERVQAVLSQHCSHGEVTYLEDDEVTACGLRIYGSPYAHYGGHNDAFKCRSPAYDVKPGVHIVATHMPAVLPGKGHYLHQDASIVEPVLRAGALLHVSGHCHWANGLYFAGSRGPSWPGPEPEGGCGAPRVPCVVASVSGANWLDPPALQSACGERGDPADRHYGGYNLLQPGIVCDIRPPEQPIPKASQAAPPAALAGTRGIPPPCPPLEAAGQPSGEPAVLFFCPPTDADLARSLLPQLATSFTVRHVETAAEGVSAVAERPFVACVAKLGHKGNMGRDVLAALRSAQGRGPLIIVHSATAAGNERTRQKLAEEFAVGLFTAHGKEAELLARLAPLAATAR